MIPHWHGYLIDIVLVLVGLYSVRTLYIPNQRRHIETENHQKVIGWAILAALVVGLAYVGQSDPEIAALKLCLWLLPTSWCTSTSASDDYAREEQLRRFRFSEYHHKIIQLYLIRWDDMSWCDTCVNREECTHACRQELCPFAPRSDLFLR